MEYTTSDLCLAATLLTFGFEIVNLDKNDPKRNMFIFSVTNTKNLDIYRLVDAFWARQLVVEPSALHTNLRLLKSMITNGYANTKGKQVN